MKGTYSAGRVVGRENGDGTAWHLFTPDSDWNRV